MSDQSPAVESPTPAPVKPGYKTTEFYFGLAAVALSTLFASGLLTSNTALAIAGIAASVLTSLGYKVSRTIVKTATILLVLALPVSQLTACTPAERAAAATTVKTAAVDCTKGKLPALVAIAAPIAEALLILSTGGDGKVDWSHAADATKGLGRDEAGCVLTKAVQHLVTPAAPQPGAPASSPLAIDTADLLAHYHAHRAAVLGGATYHTELGDL